MFLHVLFLFPETAGKTLEDVEAMFTDPTGPKYIGIPAWKTHVTTAKTLLLEKGEIDPEKAATYHEENRERSASESGAEAKI